MQTESAHRFAVQINDEFGINLNKLGCVMAKTEGIPLAKFARGIEEDLYTSPDPEKYWIHGDISSESAHLTLLYGLIKPAYEYPELVDHLIADTLPKAVRVAGVKFFPSSFEEEPYACIIASIQKTEALVHTNDRLRYLPHVSTFPEWEPHITLAYVRKGTEEHWISVLNEHLTGVQVPITGVTYGKERL